jgi:hypothetical protein
MKKLSLLIISNLLIANVTSDAAITIDSDVTVTINGMFAISKFDIISKLSFFIFPPLIFYTAAVHHNLPYLYFRWDKPHTPNSLIVNRTNPLRNEY